MASNVYSLAQEWVYHKTAYLFAIYADDIMVGFVMMGFQIYNIWRFMIDIRYQRKGYGKNALRLSIDYLCNEFNVNEVFLSFEQNNIVAEKLYDCLCFKRTGEVVGEEIEMRLDLKSLNPIKL